MMNRVLFINIFHFLATKKALNPASIEGRREVNAKRNIINFVAKNFFVQTSDAEFSD